jgi:hypothetical protein
MPLDFKSASAISEEQRASVLLLTAILLFGGGSEKTRPIRQFVHHCPARNKVIRN